MDKNRGFPPCFMTIKTECLLLFLRMFSRKLAEQQGTCNLPSDLGREGRRRRRQERKQRKEEGEEEGRKGSRLGKTGHLSWNNRGPGTTLGLSVSCASEQREPERVVPGPHEAMNTASQACRANKNRPASQDQGHSHRVPQQGTHSVPRCQDHCNRGSNPK